jgi:hypothetical protein
MCTIVLCKEEETHSFVVGQTSDAPRHIRSCGHFKFPGQYLNLLIAFASMPALSGRGTLPVELLWPATEDDLGITVVRFAEALREEFGAGEWHGEVLIASSGSVWKIDTDFITRRLSEEHAVIGEHALAVGESMRTAPEWAGRWYPNMSASGRIVNATTRAWARCGNKNVQKACRLERYAYR